MTFNLRVRVPVDVRNPWRRRLPLAIATIERLRPDLLGTQECLADQVQDLGAALPDYDRFSAGRRDGAGRGETCAVFFRRDRFEQVHGGHVWLSPTPHRPGSRARWSVFPRMATWVRLRSRREGHELTWFNTHLEAFSARARRFGAQTFCRFAAELSPCSPLLVTADLNAGEDTSPYRTLLVHGLIDAYRTAHPARSPHERTFHFFTGAQRGRRIDHVFASRHFTVAAAEIDREAINGRYPSDHFPVYADLRWPAAP